jgi:hypothetical protein
MLRRIVPILLCAALLPVAAGSACAADASVVSLRMPRGVTQAFIFLKPEKSPSVSVILFAGGHGALGLKGPSAMTWGSANFLVRSRDLFVREGFQVAVVDAPSDRRGGMNAIFRMSAAHAADIAAVAAHLKKRSG